MKHRQVTAVLLSIIVAASACMPMNALGAYAAERAGSTAAATGMEQYEAEAEEQFGNEAAANLEQVTADGLEDESAEGFSEATDAADTTEGDEEADATADAAAGTTEASDATETSDAEDDDASGSAAGTTEDDEAADAAGTTEGDEAADAAATAADAAATTADAAATAATAAAAAATDAPAMIEIIESDGVMEAGGREAKGAESTPVSVDDLLSRMIIPTDVTTASSGCALVGVPGEYIADPNAALDRINEIRREACEEGVPNPANGLLLTMDDYVPVKWSWDMEYIARIRAAESAFVSKHYRTNGTYMQEWEAITSPNGVRVTGNEDISWTNGESVTEGIDNWYEEKSDWVNQVAGTVTGHYTSMIDPRNIYVGLGTFLSDDLAFHNTTVGEFSTESGLNESRIDFTGECIQMLEMKLSNLSAEGEIVGDLGGEIGEKSKHLLATKASYTYSGNVYLMNGVDWSSSDTSVVTISSDGETTVKGMGRAVIRASFGNGGVTAEAEFVKRVENCAIDLSPASFTYDGTAKKPAVTVTYDGVKLKKGTDYKLSYSNNVNAGTAKVTVTGIGEYGGTAVKTFKIEKAEQPLACAQHPLIMEAGATETITVTGCQTTLSLETWDADVATIDAAAGATSGTVTAIAPGSTFIIAQSPENDNYKSGFLSIYVQVEKAGIYNADITVNDEVYDGTPKTPAVEVRYAGKTLKEGTDYTLTFDSNINAGTYYVTIKGIGDYQYSTRKSYKILKADQTIKAKNMSLHPYQSEKATVTGAQGTLTYQSANTTIATVSKDGTVTAVQAGAAGQAGTAQITVSAAETSNYNAGSAKMTVTVTAYDLSSSDCAAELKTNSYVYNGKTRKPAVSFVKFGDLTLTEGTDYTVSYKNNTNVGTASVIISGNNKTTTGTKTLSFTITKAEQTLSADGLKLKVGESSKVVVTGAQGTLTYKIADPSIATVADDGTVTAVAEGTTKLTINAAKTKNYKASKAIEVTVEVTHIALPGKTTRGDMFNLANNVKVTWKEVSGAKYYKVYREGVTDPSESVEEPVIVTTGLIGWDKQPGLTNGHAYRYKIVASLTGAGDSSGDSPLSYSKLMYRLKTVVIRSAKNTAPGKVTVKYDKTTSGDSYVLQYCEREDMVGAKTKVVLGAENTSYVIGGLTKGKTYYISIRVRKKVDGIDYYTTFGVAKKVTITQ